MQPSIANSFLLVAASAAYAAPFNSKGPAGSIELPLTFNVFTGAYLAPFHIGTPAQLEYLKVDTGSPTVSFMSSRNAYCNESSQPCKLYGTFDNLTSSTCSYQGSGFGDELQDAGYGVYLNDTVTLGGVATDNLYFGYLTTYGNPSALVAPQTTIAGFAENYPITEGPYLLAQLKKAGSINRKSVSVYLGYEKYNGSLVLGGFYDKAKVASKPFTVKMVDPNNQDLTENETNWVNVTKIEAVVDGNTTTYTPGATSQGQSTLLDTGNPVYELPTPIWNAVMPAYGNPTKRVYAGVNPLQVDCKYRKTANGHITTTFGDAGSITVKLAELVEKFSDGTCGLHMYEIGVSNGTAAIGAPFLRSTYAIFDQEALTITLAQAKHTTKQNIVAFPQGGF